MNQSLIKSILAGLREYAAQRENDPNLQALINELEQVLSETSDNSISVGNISNSAAVAIGQDIHMVVEQTGLPPELAMQLVSLALALSNNKPWYVRLLLRINWRAVSARILKFGIVLMVAWLTWQVGSLLERAFISNMVQYSWVLGVCLILTGLVSLALIFLKKAHLKLIALFTLVSIIGVLLIAYSMAVVGYFRWCESQCLSVTISPCLMLELQVGGGGVGQLVCPQPGSAIIFLEPEQLDSLVNLSGRPRQLTGPADYCACKWRGSINDGAFKPVSSPIGTCSFSTPLLPGTTKIQLQLETSGATEFFEWWGLNAVSQEKPFIIWVKK